jgi:hypothetical protein
VFAADPVLVVEPFPAPTAVVVPSLQALLVEEAPLPDCSVDVAGTYDPPVGNSSTLGGRG